MVLYYRLRSAITDGNEAGVCQILKLRSMTSAVWLKLCPHTLWDKIEPMQADANRLWFDILGTELEDYLEVIRALKISGEFFKILSNAILDGLDGVDAII